MYSMLKSILLASSIAIVPSTASAADLIGNGGFENPTITNPCCSTVPTATLPSWTVPTGNVNVVNGNFGSAGPNLAFEGTQYLDLVGEGGVGSLSQTFVTTIGQLYTLTFAYSHNLFGGLSSASANYSIGETSGSITHSTGSNTNLDWKTVSVNFVAPSSSTTLSFFNTKGGANEGIFLDAVSVKGAVPEPSTWMFMMLGMAGVGFSLRRKNKHTLRVRYA